MLALLMLAACERASTPSSQGETAVRIADGVMEALGGEARWDSTLGLRWTFEVTVRDSLRPGGRRHAWNMRTGEHRVEGVNARGQSYVIVHDMDTGQGQAWVDGQRIEGDSLQSLLRRGKSLWTNDSYWLLMPYKLRDPGVQLASEGPVAEDGGSYDVLALSFQNVGETPGDRYWVYVDKESRRVAKWKYLLEDAAPPAVTATWEGWEQHDGLWFPTLHRSGDRSIHTRDIEVVRAFPPGTFSQP